MKVEKQQQNLPRDLLTCKICNMIFNKPITLSCGHTFCRQCLRYKPSFINENQLNKESQKKKNKKSKLNICSICDNIIWRGQPEMRENLAIQNLIQKFYADQVIKRRKISEQLPKNYYEEVKVGQNYNKIIIRIKQPMEVPMPSCYFQAQFTTAFIDDIINQSSGLVVTWEAISSKGLGLFCKMRKVEPIIVHSAFSRIVFDTKSSDSVLELKYKGYFLGLNFVKFDNIETIDINLRHKLIVLGEEAENKIVKSLEICDCSIFHSANRQNIEIQNFNLFFSIYDNMNNPHYLRQILTLISDQPFQNRVSNQNTIYCVLRLLKMSNEQRKKLVYCFDDKERIQQINNWLLSHRNKMIDEIINVKIPGKYNTGLVFFIIFVLFAFNFFQDYNTKNGN